MTSKQKTIGHNSTSASLHYELVEREKGVPFMGVESKDNAAVRSEQNTALVGDVRTTLHSNKHK